MYISRATKFSAIILQVEVQEYVVCLQMAVDSNNVHIAMFPTSFLGAWLPRIMHQIYNFN